jgi:hypothetical protein
MPRASAAPFIEELAKIDGEAAWVVGDVIEGAIICCCFSLAVLTSLGLSGDNKAFIADDVAILDV